MQDTATFFKIAAERISANNGVVPPELWEAVVAKPAKTIKKTSRKKYQSELHENADRAIRKYLFGQNF